MLWNDIATQGARLRRDTLGWVLPPPWGGCPMVAKRPSCALDDYRLLNGCRAFDGCRSAVNLGGYPL